MTKGAPGRFRARWWCPLCNSLCPWLTFTDFTFRRFTGFGSCAISSHPRASSLHVLLCYAVCFSHLLVHRYPAVVLVRYAKTVFHPLAFDSGRLSVIRHISVTSGPSERCHSYFSGLFVPALPFPVPHLGEAVSADYSCFISGSSACKHVDDRHHSIDLSLLP